MELVTFDQQASNIVLEPSPSDRHQIVARHGIDLVSSENNLRLKKATKIIRDLARDVQKDPSTATVIPSTWLIRCLVKSHFCDIPNANWRLSAYWTLQYIAQCSSLHNPMHTTFVELDGVTPLYPNSEAFTIAHTYRFAITLLRYLEKQHP